MIPLYFMNNCQFENLEQSIFLDRDPGCCRPLWRECGEDQELQGVRP